MARIPAPQEPEMNNSGGICHSNKSWSCDMNMWITNFSPYGPYSTTPVVNCHSNQHIPPDSGCYGYSRESSELYSCPGHRNALENQNNITPNPQSLPQHPIEIQYLLELRTALNNEIAARQQHKMYESFPKDNTKMNSGALVDVNTPNLLEQSIAALKNKIKNYEDHDSNISANTLSDIYVAVETGQIITHSQLSGIYAEINNKWKDCICHSDCTAFGKIGSMMCECNSNCGCDYGLFHQHIPPWPSFL